MNQHSLKGSVSIAEKTIRVEEECGVPPECLDKIGMFRDCNSKEYIKKKFPTEKWIDQLAFSAWLCHEGLDIKLHNEGCLMTANGNFVAKVRLENPQLITQAVDFGEAKKILLQQLRIFKVLQDDLTAERNKWQSSLVQTIESVLQQTSKNRNNLENIQLYFLLSTHSDSFNFSQLCEAINENKLISIELRSTAASFLEFEARSTTRDKVLALFHLHQSKTPSTEIIVQLRRILDENVSAHRKQLLEIAPISLRKYLSSCSNDRIIFVQHKDVALLSDMTKDLNKKMFEEPLTDLADRWIDSVEKLTVSTLHSVEGIMNTTFYLLAKSLQELIAEITNKTDHRAEDLLTSTSCGWHSINKITWKSENVSTKCLEREYFFIFELLKHFDLNYDSEKQSFKYTVERFGKRKQHLTCQQLARSLELVLSDENKPTKITDEKYIWYCLLDDVLFHTMPAEYEFDCFETFFEGYVSFMIGAGIDQMEMLRVVTHSTTRFMVQTMSFLVQKDCSTIDHQILQQQLTHINAKSIQSTVTSNGFRNLVKEFEIYWKHREGIVTEITSKICLPEMASLKRVLLEIVLVALDKTVAAEVLECFFRSYFELLIILNNVRFDWYVKAFPNVSMTTLEDLKLIELVDSKWTITGHKTYRVIAVEKFVNAASFFFESYPLPKHYVIEVLLTMLSCVKNQLTKVQCKSGRKLSEEEQFCTSSELLDAAKKSCVYLRKQPDYKSFELFLNELIEPFTIAI
ncbi:uncharacterized protein LOC129733547 [Wyeomyia smithii]|uniref:uncharacterized protein LOC129733547 n=1 Tax=Wyeomyia smithii TaxID=174621 RepID=UPI002467F81E|nr:uncharacterized protein LOC129733547 [Wyeomyia smithii]